MGTKLEYYDLKRQIDFSYSMRKEEQEKYLNGLWKDLNKKVEELEEMVKEEFLDTVKNIELNGSEVLSSRVRYDPGSKQLNIKISKWKTPSGEIIMDEDKKFPPSYICPHSALAPILGFMGKSPDPLIIDFKENVFQ